MADGVVHIIVSSLNWNQPLIRYRRHRLVEYLSQQNDTADIIWVYPVSASPRKPSSYAKAKQIMQKNPLTNNMGIKEWALPDLAPGRYMQFKSSCGHPEFAKFKRFIGGYGSDKVLWFTYPLYPYIAEILKWDLIVYDCSDLWTEPSGGCRSNTFSSKVAGPFIDSAERFIINKSKILFASSDFLAARINTISRRQAVTIENGVDTFYFQNYAQITGDVLDNVPRPRLGYVGAMRSKIDFNLLNELALAKPEWNIVLVGPDCLNRKDDFLRLIERDNVFWIGEVKPETVPEYMKSLDVGLLPYCEIEYNRAVFPLKFYEYLSQGVFAAGCGIPATNKYASEGIYLHVGRNDFIEACGKILSWSPDNANTFYDKRIELAREAGWEKKLSLMLSVVREYL